jgi:hypothetical protein
VPRGEKRREIGEEAREKRGMEKRKEKWRSNR